MQPNPLPTMDNRVNIRTTEPGASNHETTEGDETLDLP